MHNDVVKSDIHSTDTHGYTEAIFGAMHLLGFSYAPRIKISPSAALSRSTSVARPEPTGRSARPPPSTPNRSSDPLGRHPAVHRDDPAQGSHRLGPVQPAQLLLQPARPLPGPEGLRQDPQVRFPPALHRHVDLRQAIEHQLNKVESSNQFSRAISFGNGHESGRGKDRSGSGRRLQAADQKRHYLLELSLL